MGTSAITTIAIGLGLMLFGIYCASDSFQFVNQILINMGVSEENIKYLMSFFTQFQETSKEEPTPSKSDKLFTPEELKKYDGTADSKGLYLAILGEVFDVSKGAQHYKPGGGYAFFSGRDATRAYITGDFSENGLNDKVDDLEDASLNSLNDWLGFYKEEYILVGKVIGRYYDSSGKPTKELELIQKRMEKSHKLALKERMESYTFPPCNTEWSKEKGSKVWCTNKSGGIDREWVGLPRELHQKGKDPRCVCVKDFGPPSDNSKVEEHSNRGDLDHPDLKEYPNCPSDSLSCNVNHP